MCCWATPPTTPTPTRYSCRVGRAGQRHADAHRLKLPPFDKPLYRWRNLVEQFFNKLKHFRAVATHYDNRDDNYIVSFKLASMRIWMLFNESVT